MPGLQYTLMLLFDKRDGHAVEQRRLDGDIYQRSVKRGIDESVAQRRQERCLWRGVHRGEESSGKCKL